MSETSTQFVVVVVVVLLVWALFVVTAQLVGIMMWLARDYVAAGSHHAESEDTSTVCSCFLFVLVWAEFCCCQCANIMNF
jgi:uncharacterized iron-regulated membrane protein